MVRLSTHKKVNTMKLFLISQKYNRGFDTYDSAVVAAQDEATARHMDPETGHPLNWGRFSPLKPCVWWCSSPDRVTVVYLGEAGPGIEQGVICASFNAG